MTMVNAPQSGDCGYIAMYRGKQIEIHAPSLYGAKTKAIMHFKVPQKQQGLVTVILCQRADGSEVIHKPTDFIV